MKIGKKLRDIRKEKGMTLKELSQKSGVALATLSRIENDKMTGTIKSHLRICKTLNVSITDLYGQLEEDSKFVERPAETRAEKYSRAEKTAYQLLIPKMGKKKIRPILIKLSPGGKTKAESSNPGSEKFIYMLKGQITAKIGKKEYELKKGDSLYFEASLVNTFKNKSKQKVEILSITA